MRALLLAAGFGTRLRPLTNSVPKCLVTIKGEPLLGIWLERLGKAGVGPILINTHYLSAQVNSFIAGSKFQKNVAVVHEPNLLGTAGTLIANLDFFDGEDAMLIHADNYCLADLEDFQDAHRNRPKGCLMTMMTFRTDAPSTCGIVEVNNSGVVVGFYEKVSNPPGNLANGAIYILSAELLADMKNKFSAAKDFSLDVLGNLIGEIYSYESSEIFIDVGTPISYSIANS